MDPLETPKIASLLTPEAIKIGASFDRYIELVLMDRADSGKIVIARVDGLVIVGIGDVESYHSVIIDNAAQEVLNRPVTNTRNPDHARPLPGVVVEGARFRFNRKEEEPSVKIFDRSMSFGGFSSEIFAESTVAVLERFLLSKILEASVPKDVSNETFSSVLRDMARQELPPPNLNG